MTNLTMKTTDYILLHCLCGIDVIENQLCAIQIHQNALSYVMCNILYEIFEVIQLDSFLV